MLIPKLEARVSKILKPIKFSVLLKERKNGISILLLFKAQLVSTYDLFQKS